MVTPHHSDPIIIDDQNGDKEMFSGGIECMGLEHWQPLEQPLAFQPTGSRKLFKAKTYISQSTPKRNVS